MTTRVDDSAIKWTSEKSVKPGLGLWPISVHKVTITFADLEASAMTDTVSLATSDGGTSFPQPARVIGAFAVLREAFDDNDSASSVALDVGDAVNPDELLDAADVFGGSAGDVLEDGGDGMYTAMTREASYAPIATFTSDVNVDTLTQGRVEVYIMYIEPAADPAST